MLGKKKDTPAIQQAAHLGASFELAIGDLARKSERRAWMVAFSSLALTLLLAGGYYFMLPLKEKVPYVVVADPL
jgi:type IV secretion system protein VirB8